MHLRLGLDIGGTKMEAALLASHPHGHDVVARERIPTQRELGLESVFGRMVSLVKSVLNQNGTELTEIEGIGIGLPGAVDPKTQQMLNGNTSLFVGQDLRQKLAQALNFNRPICIANDANCFALAEALLGAGKRHAEILQISPTELTSIGVILGTGVGGGLVVKGQFLEGKNGGAGEIGHTVLDPNGPKCFCGRQGCAETLLSGRGFETWYKERFKEEYFAMQIFDRAQMMDSNAIKAIEMYQQYLELFLVNLINFFDPDFIVFGGGVSLQTTLYQGLEERVYKKTFIPSVGTKIYQNQLGDSAGVIGAALLLPIQ